MSPALRIEPGLLRALRQVLPAQDADIGTEIDAWNHPDVDSSSPVGLSFQSKAVERWRRAFLELEPVLQEQAVAVIRRWHTSLPQEIWQEEVLSLVTSGALSLVSADEVEAMECFWQQLAVTVQEEGEQASHQLPILHWFARACPRLPQRAWKDSELGPVLTRTLRLARSRLKNVPVPELLSPAEVEEYAGQSERRYALWEVGGGLEVRANGVAEALQAAGRSPWIEILSAREFLHLETKSVEPLPSWAIDGGEDRYGRWAAFEVEGVRVRMRWIPPGTFLLGSPEDEEERDDDEGPQHQVTLSRGYWLAEVPTTQDLWQAVTGKNPSYFKGPRRPVEQVSWDDCQQLLVKLNECVAGLRLRLPTEAEWEYACRAGTRTSRYSSELEGIAWYGANSEGGTHEVGEKGANAWGLFDTLGNVFEWCQDWKGDYSAEAVTDPQGPELGSDRVVRGGSWIYDARYVRAAYRNWRPPGDRFSHLGVRLAQDQEEPAEPKKRAGETEAEQGAGRAGDAGDLERESHGEGLWQRIPLGSGPAKVVLPKAPAVIITSDRQRVELRRFTRPEWASAAGRDRFGLWAAFEVGRVEVRMRWIPPGRFWMGSPESETPRYANEGPQHLVTWTCGFWMGEFPVTQDLWQGVTGENPSYFKSDRRPVEQVSWEDCQEFVSKLNQTRSGLALRLPSEAEWEYACRAGTQTATYSGIPEILAKYNAPMLDAIAWYGGNCTHGFDLEKGSNMSGWEGRQYSGAIGGTRSVGLKQPNAWGMYDMLGNVNELCADRLGLHPEYGIETQVDPLPADSGSFSVVRGGSWDDSADCIRAAFRRSVNLSEHLDYVGFRLARDPE